MGRISDQGAILTDHNVSIRSSADARPWQEPTAWSRFLGDWPVALAFGAAVRATLMGALWA